MKLNKKQKKHFLELLAEGLETGEINKRAAKFKPAFEVTRSQVDYYRKTREVDLQKIKEEDENSALKTGLAVRENRVKLLNDMAEKLRKDLFEGDKIWLDQAKGLGSGPTWERYEYKEFNAGEIAQLRGILDDIASEMNERIKRTELTGKDGQPLVNKLKDLDFNLLPTEVLKKLADGADPTEVILKYAISQRDKETG